MIPPLLVSNVDLFYTLGPSKLVQFQFWIMAVTGLKYKILCSLTSISEPRSILRKIYVFIQHRKKNNHFIVVIKILQNKFGKKEWIFSYWTCFWHEIILPSRLQNHQKLKNCRKIFLENSMIRRYATDAIYCFLIFEINSRLLVDNKLLNIIEFII